MAAVPRRTQVEGHVARAAELTAVGGGRKCDCEHTLLTLIRAGRNIVAASGLSRVNGITCNASLTQTIYAGHNGTGVNMLSLSLRVIAFVVLTTATSALMALPYLSIQ
jgi:hypothetical protein